MSFLYLLNVAHFLFIDVFIISFFFFGQRLRFWFHVYVGCITSIVTLHYVCVCVCDSFHISHTLIIKTIIALHMRQIFSCRHYFPFSFFFSLFLFIYFSSLVSFSWSLEYHPRAHIIAFVWVKTWVWLLIYVFRFADAIRIADSRSEQRHSLPYVYIHILNLSLWIYSSTNASYRIFLRHIALGSK